MLACLRLEFSVYIYKCDHSVHQSSWYPENYWNYFFVAAGLTENSMKIIRATFKNLSCKNKNKTQLTTLRESEEVKLLKKNMLIWHISITNQWATVPRLKHAMCSSSELAEQG